jgi:hypothetical protein
MEFSLSFGRERPYACRVARLDDRSAVSGGIVEEGGWLRLVVRKDDGQMLVLASSQVM